MVQSNGLKYKLPNCRSCASKLPISTNDLLARFTSQLPDWFRICKQGILETSTNSSSVQGTVCKPISVPARKFVTNHLLLLQTQLHNFEDERLTTGTACTREQAQQDCSNWIAVLQNPVHVQCDNSFSQQPDPIACAIVAIRTTASSANS